VFWASPPPARQIENWQPVVCFPGKSTVLGTNPALWRAVVLEAAMWTNSEPSSSSSMARLPMTAHFVRLQPAEVKNGKLTANGEDRGTFKKGDKIVLDEEGQLFVNGERR